MFLRKNIPDTTKPAYNQKIRTPDYSNWNKYERTGYLALYSMISDAIIRSKSEPM
jgi:asparagine synthetase A